MPWQSTIDSRFGNKCFWFPPFWVCIHADSQFNRKPMFKFYPHILLSRSISNDLISNAIPASPLKWPKYNNNKTEWNAGSWISIKMIGTYACIMNIVIGIRWSRERLRERQRSKERAQNEKCSTRPIQSLNYRKKNITFIFDRQHCMRVRSSPLDRRFHVTEPNCTAV